jgi:hypothetical protein
MPYDDKMKISELRKILKEHRKTAVTPVSKMPKHQILMELDKYAATPSSTPSLAPVVVEGKKAVKKEEKAEVKPGTSLSKPQKVKVPIMPLQEPVAAKKELDKSVEPKKDVGRVKLIKGSKEARDFMASIRMKKTKSDDVS